jgi:hypothetical protein
MDPGVRRDDGRRRAGEAKRKLAVALETRLAVRLT